MKRKKLLLILVTLLFIFMPIFYVRAYALLYGYGYSTPYLIVRNNSFYNSQVIIATNNWYLATDVKPVVCNSCSTADIFVYNSTSLGSGTIGYTRNYSNGSHIYMSKVYLNNNSGYFPSYSTYQRVAYIGHELGHTWGLAHTSYDWALMYSTDRFYTYYGHYTPQSDDINGANYLY